MKKKLTITVSLAALFLTSCQNDLPKEQSEKEIQEEKRKNGIHIRSSYKDSTSNKSGEKPHTSSKKSVSRGGFAHGGGCGGG